HQAPAFAGLERQFPSESLCYRMDNGDPKTRAIFSMTTLVAARETSADLWGLLLSYAGATVGDRDAAAFRRLLRGNGDVYRRAVGGVGTRLVARLQEGGGEG